MEDNGMVTVFCVYDTDLNTEVYLLDDWRESEDGNVSNWVQNLTSKGVGDGKGNCLPMFNFDCNNLAWSVKAVLASIMIDIWENTKEDLGYNYYGPDFFCTIIQNQHQVNSYAVHAFVQYLKYEAHGLNRTRR